MSAAPTTPVVRAERREMGISHADFRRVFPRLVSEAEAEFDTAGACIRWADGRRLVVRLAAERERRIALLRLPVTDVHFEFTAFPAAARDAFLARFDRAFQKGGG